MEKETYPFLFKVFDENEFLKVLKAHVPVAPGPALDICIL